MENKYDIIEEFCESIFQEIEDALKSNYIARKHMIDNERYDTKLFGIIEGKIAALRGIEYFIEQELNKVYTENK